MSGIQKIFTKFSFQNFTTFISSHKTLIRDSVGLGASWVLGISLVMALPVWALLTYLGDGYETTDVVAVVIAFTLSALGARMNFETYGYEYEFDNLVSTSISIRPTFLTLIFIILMYRFGKKLRDKGGRKVAIIGALSAAFGTSLTAGLASELISNTRLEQFGADLFETSLVLKPASAIDFFVISMFVLGSVIAGFEFKQLGESYFWKSIAWARAMWINVVKAQVVLLLAGLTIFALYRLIEPDWAISQPISEATNQDTPFNWYLVGVLVAVILYLPTLFLNLLGISLGSGVGLEVHGEFYLLPGFSELSNFVYEQDLGSLYLSDVSSKWVAFALALILILVALISGSAISLNSGQVNRMRFFVGEFFAFIGLGYLAVIWSRFSSSGYLVSFGTYNRPSRPLTVAEGEMAFGLNLKSTVFIFVVIALVGLFSSLKLGGFIHSAFPRMQKRLTHAYAVNELQAERTLSGRIFGLATSTVVLLFIATAVSSVTVERIWGAVDSPGALANRYAEAFQNKDLEKVKEIFNSSSATGWLDDDILKTTLNNVSSDIKINVKNNSGDDWSVGNLDATATVVWNYEDGKVRWNIPTEAELETKFKLVEHPNFKALISPVTFNLSANSYLPAENRAEVKVNGVPVIPGTYKTIPGEYKIEAPGYLLIAPTSETVFLGSNNTSFKVGTEVKLPSVANTLLKTYLDQKLARCSTLGDSLESECISAIQALKGATVTKSTIPQNFFTKEVVSSKVDKTNCSDNFVDVLNSASQMTRTWDCVQNITFTQRYFEADFRSRDVYRYESYLYWCGGWSICEGTRRVYAGTETYKVRGAAIADVTFTNKVDFVVKAIGSLDSTGAFAVKK